MSQDTFATSGLPDEHTLDLPHPWLRELHPRRGGPALESVELDESAVTTVSGMVGEFRDAIEKVFHHENTEPELARRGRAHLKGDADPLGAAVVAGATISQQVSFREAETASAFVDSWVAEGGLAFAACAFAEFWHLAVWRRGSRWWICSVGAGQHSPVWMWAGAPVGRRLRTMLATAGDQEYAEAVDRLADHRRTSMQRVVVSYLVPTRQDWVEECCATPPVQGGERDLRWMLFCAVSTAAQLDLLAGRTPLDLAYQDPDVIATLVEGLGSAAPPFLDEAVADALAEILDEYPGRVVRKQVLGLLAVLPNDAAFQVMVDRLAAGDVQTALIGAMRRFPIRALRMVAPEAAGTSKSAIHAAGLLSGHLRANPELTGAALPGLPDEARTVIESISAATVEEASADALPRLLVEPPWTRKRKARKLLAIDPLDILPARPPKVGDWADPALFPQVVLRGGDLALPVAAAGHVITMLAMSKPGEAYAGVEVVRELCDPESLAEFAWALFRQWQLNGAPSKDGWALTQLGWLGDDETVRRLTPVIRAWPGEGGHKQAVNGLDVLAAIGSDVALMHLYGISQKVKFKGIKARAQEKIAEVAGELELTAEELADRLVPDFGLDTEGSLTLDYGSRRFVVGLDEQLRPYVADGDGNRLKALPKPGVKDDDELAPAAYKRFTGLKKDVRTVAADQIRRLESAMVARRRWTAGEFQALFAAHPLLWHIARRLVWLSEDGGKVTAFRLAEDRTLADVGDDVLTLPESASVGIAHPLDLGDGLGAWSEVFADYEILQPFPQLGRAVHALTGEERQGGRLHRFEGLTVPFGKVLGLERRGWKRGEPQARIECWISREIPGNRHIVIDLNPGFAVGLLDEFPEQKLEHVWIADRPGSYWPGEQNPWRFGELDPVTASEVLADLTELADSAV